MKYHDIHTHQNTIEADVLSVLNCNIYDYKTLNNSQLYSCGLHPWDVESDFEFQMESLYMMASQPHVVAVGECGLDKVRYKSDLKIQKAAFEVQLQIAENLAKPVVIHCVRAQEEMLGIQRKLKPKTPLIVHGFNQKTAIGLQYLKQGFYLSLGAALLIEGSNAQQVLEKIPVEFLFLETDDTIISIKSVYKKAASLLNMDEIELEKQLESNFNTIFGK